MAKIAEFQGDYRWLSNFWPSIIHLNNMRFITAEHAYQASKTVNQNEREYIARQISPAAAKRAGRNVTIRPNWDEMKVDIMRLIVSIKFSEPQLATWLLATGDMVLEEGNYWNDTFWGIDLRTGRGQNRLGLILMNVRSDLRLQQGG